MLPVTAVAPMVVLPFRQIDLALPAAAAGNGFTVTVTLCVLVHPVAVMVSTTVYVVFTSGLTDGLAAVEVNPAGTEVQLYVLPVTDAAPRVVLAFRQIARSVPATAAGRGFTVTTTLWVLVQPVAVMVSTIV